MDLHPAVPQPTSLLPFLNDYGATGHDSGKLTDLVRNPIRQFGRSLRARTGGRRRGKRIKVSKNAGSQALDRFASATDLQSALRRADGIPEDMADAFCPGAERLLVGNGSTDTLCAALYRDPGFRASEESVAETIAAGQDKRFVQVLSW